MEDYIKHSAVGISLGAMDTVRFSPPSHYPVLIAGLQTTAVLSWFFMAMALHPEVQAKAQAEIDEVVGNERLPRIEDKESLPYVSAVMQEVFRWHPAVKLGANDRFPRVRISHADCCSVPHAVSKDDEYRGYFIPAKTTLIANVW